MSAVRLIILATVVVGVLAIVVALAPPVPDDNDRPVGTPPAERSATDGSVGGSVRSSKAPRKALLEAQVGDSVVLRIDPREDAYVEAPDLGVLERVSGGLPTEVRFTATRTGTYRVRYRGGATLARIRITQTSNARGDSDTPSPEPPAGIEPTPASVLPVG